MTQGLCLPLIRLQHREQQSRSPLWRTYMCIVFYLVMQSNRLSVFPISSYIFGPISGDKSYSFTSSPGYIIPVLRQHRLSYSFPKGWTFVEQPSTLGKYNLNSKHKTIHQDYWSMTQQNVPVPFNYNLTNFSWIYLNFYKKKKKYMNLNSLIKMLLFIYEGKKTTYNFRSKNKVR